MTTSSLFAFLQASTSLSSAGSSIVSILGTLYVWYGKGSLPIERSSALSYARNLHSSSSSSSHLDIVENQEGYEEETFWSFFDSQRYDSSPFHLHRSQLQVNQVEPSVLLINSTTTSQPKVTRWGSTPTLSSLMTLLSSSSDEILILSTGLEIFVLVPSDLRNRRRCISLALEVAEELSLQLHQDRINSLSEEAVLRPLVHVLVQPTVFPLALRSSLRGGHVEEGEEKGLMNLLSLEQARRELSMTKEVDPRLLEREDWLPLGISPLDLTPS